MLVCSYATLWSCTVPIAKSFSQQLLFPNWFRTRYSMYSSVWVSSKLKLKLFFCAGLLSLIGNAYGSESAGNIYILFWKILNCYTLTFQMMSYEKCDK